MKDIKRSAYFKFGITALIVLCGSLFFYFLLFHTGSFRSAVGKILTVVRPLLYGLLIAYILNPLMQWFENRILKLTRSVKIRPSRGMYVTVRIISVFLSAGVMVLVVYFLMRLLLPQLIESIQSIITNFRIYQHNVENWFDTNFNSENASIVSETIVEYSDQLYQWVMDRLPDLGQVASNVTTGALAVLSFLWNVILGIIIAFYVLSSKDLLAAKWKRYLYTSFSIRTANRILHNLRFVDQKFGGFIIGKIIDSAIIGVLCYFCMLIMKMPYATLIAVVIGITNVIPFFGPFIGAVPCAVLVFVNSPIKALYFILFIFLLQQFDGNILGPHILGNSTGLSGLAVVLAIILCNSIFGITGAFIGVPLVATVMGFLQSGIRMRAERKNMPKDLDYYSELSRINEETLEPVPLSKQRITTSLYDKIKYQDRSLFDGGAERFLPKETAVRKGNQTDLPADPVNVSREEAAASKNIPIVK